MPVGLARSGIALRAYRGSAGSWTASGTSCSGSTPFRAVAQWATLKRDAATSRRSASSPLRTGARAASAALGDDHQPRHRAMDRAADLPGQLRAAAAHRQGSSPQVDEFHLAAAQYARRHEPRFTDKKNKREAVFAALKQFPEILLAMTTVATPMAATTRGSTQAHRARQARARRRISARHTQRAQTHSGIGSQGYDRPILQTLGPDRTRTKLINEFAAKVAKVRIADSETSESFEPGPVDPAQQRCGRRSGHRCNGSARRSGLLAGETTYWLDRTAELQSTAAAEQASARLRPRQPVCVDQQARPRRGTAHGAAASGRRHRRARARRSSSGRICSDASRSTPTLRAVRRAT